MPGKAIIILLLGMIVIMGFVLGGILNTSNNISKNMVSDYQRKITYNIAQSGANIGLRQLKDNPAYRNTAFTVSDMMYGKVNIRVIDTTVGSSSVAVLSTGFTNYGTANQISYTSIALPPNNSIPSLLGGAFTSPAGVSYKFNGGGEIDGRNYDVNNNLISPGGTGTYAIWSKGTVDIPGKSAKIGGTTSSGADVIPYAGGDSDTSIVYENQPIPSSYPINPDQVMGGSASGFPDGTLKAIAKTAVGGNQYIQSSGGSLPSYTSPFSGVTYIDYNGGSLNISGSGILVINSSKPTSLEIKGDIFTGIVILSNNIDFGMKQGGVVGKVIVMGPESLNSSLSMNGKGILHYSSQAVQNGIKLLPSSGKVVWLER